MTGPLLYPHLGGIDLKLFRIAGPGLGNSLFPLARAISDSYKYNLQLIEPSWLNLKPGSWLRGDRDKRIYSELFKSLGFLKLTFRVPLFMFLPKISEENIITASRNKKVCIAIYKGMSGLFTPIIKDHQLIKKELENRVIPNIKNFGKPSKFIAVHVRLGDFSNSSNSGPQKGQDNHRLPMWWYEEKINLLKNLFPEIPVWIFSDGSDEELRTLLTIENCQRAPQNSAINDILTMAQAGVLIASGSTFSMWASYLGRMPVIWFPGQMRQKLYFESSHCEIESDKENVLPENFLLMVNKRWCK